MPSEDEQNERTREILKKVRQIELRTNRLVTDSMAGEYHSVFKGRGMDFDEVREYSPGDEVRLIDWNVTARSGTPFIKKFTEERELTILLVVDVSASGTFGSGTQSKRELAAEVASVLAFSAIRNKDKVGLILFTDQIEAYIPPQKGRKHVLRVIREILFFEPRRKGTDVPMVLDFINQVQKKRSIVFLLSDFCVSKERPDSLRVLSELDAFRVATSDYEPLRSAMRLTNKRHDLVAACIQDPHEFILPEVGLITVEDAETGEQFEVDTNSSKLRRAFQRLSVQRVEAFEKTARGVGVQTLSLTTGTPYVPILMRFFASRASR